MVVANPRLATPPYTNRVLLRDPTPNHALPVACDDELSKFDDIRPHAEPGVARISGELTGIMFVHDGTFVMSNCLHDAGAIKSPVGSLQTQSFRAEHVSYCPSSCQSF